MAVCNEMLSVDGATSSAIPRMSQSRKQFRHLDHQGRFRHTELYLPTLASRARPRPVDLVIIYTSAAEGKHHSLNSVIESLSSRLYRERFEAALTRQGLEIETLLDNSDGKSLVALKLHATDYFMLSRADSSDLKAPVAPHDMESKGSIIHDVCDKLAKPNGIHNPYRMRNDADNQYGDPHRYFMSAPYAEKQKDMFLSGKASRLFTTIQRTNLVWDCVRTTTIPYVPPCQVEAKFLDKIYEPTTKDKNHQNVTFQWLLHKHIYTDVFPLHDYDYKLSDARVKSLPRKQWPLRVWLYQHWAKANFSVQPLNAIRAYFGEVTGLYFAWLGFYTAWLFIPVIFGVITFLFGIVKAFGVYNPDLDEICHGLPDKPDMMCRSCQSLLCDFAPLEILCSQRRIQITFEHYMTIMYSFVVSIWALLVIEFWERWENELAMRWEVSKFQQAADLSSTRTDYLTSMFVRYWKNPATGELEFFIPWKRLAWRRVISTTITVVFLVIQSFILYGIIEFRARILIIFKAIGADGNGAIRTLTPEGMISITSALINACSIYIMQIIWGKLVKSIVGLELQKTTAAYQNSYAYKMAFFQFINYYGLLFYLALLKGKSQEVPSNQSSTFDNGCGAAGCLFDVSIQAFILMTVKQLFSHFMELVLPWVKIKCSRLLAVVRMKLSSRRRSGNANSGERMPLWKKDWLLIKTETELLHYDDYLNTAVQLGFIVIFTTAFPLAPLLALANNLLKIRIDALKYLKVNRRPIPVPRGDIGPWIPIFRMLVALAVVVNAFVIAFTTNIIDNTVHSFRYEPNNISLQAVLFNVFNTSGYPEELQYNHYWLKNGTLSQFHVESCLYDARFIFKPDLMYDKINRHYIQCARLAFVIVFLILVTFFKTIISMMVPDVPKDVLKKMDKSDKFIAGLQLKRMERAVANKKGKANGAVKKTDAGSQSQSQLNSINTIETKAA